MRSGFPQVEGVELEPWEARRGPRRAKQGPTRPKNWTTFIKQKNYINLETVVYGAPDSYMEIKMEWMWWR